MTKGSWILLDSIAYDSLTEDQKGETDLFRTWHILQRGMEPLGLDFFYEIKSVILPVESTKIIKLPPDFANYSKVGILNNFGEIIPFTYNKNLTLFADNNPQRLTKIQSDNYYSLYQPNSYCYYNYWDGFGFGNLYGVPSGGYKATFRIDEPNHVIVLEHDFTYANIVLEYVAFPKEGEPIYVPAIFREALVAWLSWKTLPPKLKGGGQWRALRSDFYNERRLAIARYKPFHLLEAYEWNLQTQRLTVKV